MSNLSDTQTVPMTTASEPGRVVFVGAGPGDPDLLTMAAVTAVRNADVIVGDDEQLLDVVRSLGPLKADSISAAADLPSSDTAVTMSCRLSEAGKVVVRLMRGDPFLDGGAGSEATHCARAGQKFEVIPGVSMLTAVPEYAGVAFDDEADGVGFVALSDKQAAAASAQYWDFAGSLVMALRASGVPAFARSGIDAGRPRTEPVLVTIGGASTNQRSVQTTLGDMPFAVTGVPGDQLIHVVVGKAAAARATELDWFESKPLFGWNVLVPRTKDTAMPMITRLRSYGAQYEEVATISVERPRTPQQMDRAIRGLVEGEFEWIVFTSSNALKAVREKFEEYGLDARAFSGLKVAAVSAATAADLRAWGIEPDLAPASEGGTAALADVFPEFDEDLDPINRVLLPRADIATETLAEALVDLGWEVEDVTAYRTVRASPPAAEIREGIKAGNYDAVLFSSSSTVRNFVGIAGKPHSSTIVGAIGPATAKTCEEHGLRVDVLAERPTGVDLADALAVFAQQRRADLVAAGLQVTRPSQRTRRRRKAREVS